MTVLIADVGIPGEEERVSAKIGVRWGFFVGDGKSMGVEGPALQSSALLMLVGKAEGGELRAESGLSLRGKGTVRTSDLQSVVDEERERSLS